MYMYIHTYIYMFYNIQIYTYRGEIRVLYMTPEYVTLRGDLLKTIHRSIGKDYY